MTKKYIYIINCACHIQISIRHTCTYRMHVPDCVGLYALKSLMYDDNRLHVLTSSAQACAWVCDLGGHTNHYVNACHITNQQLFFKKIKHLGTSERAF